MAGDPSRTMDRRSFVQGITSILTGVLTALHPLAAVAPSRAWAVELHTLSQVDAATLLAMIHTIAPHDGLDEAAYALVVGAIDAEATASADHRAQLDAGLVSLGNDFVVAAEDSRVTRLQLIEASAFFQSIRLKTLLVLYNNPIAWTHFGYEGEAFSKGGYLLRGFNDLKWLPDVPLTASGPMPIS
jgi:hypothetical protein